MAHEVHFSGYLYVADYTDREDIEDLFKEIMLEDHPEIEVDKILNIEEVKV
jgi:hypothetical protein